MLNSVLLDLTQVSVSSLPAGPIGNIFTDVRAELYALHDLIQHNHMNIQHTHEQKDLHT